MKIGIIGAGHAGVEAAKTAVQNGAEVTLYSAEDIAPYYRPKIVAYSFGRTSLENILMHPFDWYEKNNIELRLNSPVSKIDPGTKTITANNRKESYDALILSTGAGPIIPPFAQNAPRGTTPLWNIQHANLIRSRNYSGSKLVIIGGGIIGIEAALLASENGTNVTIVEKMEHLMSRNFGEEASEILKKQLQKKNITVLTGRSALNITSKIKDTIIISLDKDTVIDTDTVLLSIGACRDVSLFNKSGIDSRYGVKVNNQLSTNHKNIFACGDIVQLDGCFSCSAREAAMQGKVAGINACLSLNGKALSVYKADAVPVFFKHNDFELYSAGEAPDAQSEQYFLEDSNEFNYRALIIKGGIATGIQMIGCTKDFLKYTKQLGSTVNNEQ